MKIARFTCNYCSIACNLDFNIEDNGFINRIVIKDLTIQLIRDFVVKGLNLDKQKYTT